MTPGQKKKIHQNRLRKRAADRKRKRKKFLSNLLANGLIVGVIVGVIVAVVTGLIDQVNSSIDKNFAYQKEAFEQLYMPAHINLLSQEEPLTVNQYIAVMEKAIQGNEKLLGYEEILAWNSLQIKKKEHTQIPLITAKTVKRQKEIELLAAARQFDARFNERFQIVTDKYFSMMGERVPNYKDTILVDTNRIKPFDNITTSVNGAQLHLINNSIR